MGRTVKMEYPHGWVEDYHYDSIGQLLKVEDTDPTQKDMKQQKHVYEYDACGNMTYEYMRGNGTGEATVENTYTYDALHRVTSVHENYGNDNRSYTYDSLGNLTYETAQGNKSVDYKLNNLNQITSSSDDGWKTSTAYTYDKLTPMISGAIWSRSSTPRTTSRASPAPTPTTRPTRWCRASMTSVRAASTCITAWARW